MRNSITEQSIRNRIAEELKNRREDEEARNRRATDDLIPPCSRLEKSLRLIGGRVKSSGALLSNEAAASVLEMDSALHAMAVLYDHEGPYPVRDDLDRYAILYLWKIFEREDFRGVLHIQVPDKITKTFMESRMVGHEGYVNFEVVEAIEEERRSVRKKRSDSRFISIAKQALNSVKSYFGDDEDSFYKKFLEPPDEFMCRKNASLMTSPVIGYPPHQESCQEENRDKHKNLLISVDGVLMVNTGTVGYTGQEQQKPWYLSYEESPQQLEGEVKLQEVPNVLLRDIMLNWADEFLKNVNKASSVGFYGLGFDRIPKAFLCPISGKIMDCPVLFSDLGETFDLESLPEIQVENPMEKQLYRRCPRSGKVVQVFENQSVKRLIEKWRLEMDWRAVLVNDRQTSAKVEDHILRWCRIYLLEVLKEIQYRPNQLELFKQISALTRRYDSCAFLAESNHLKHLFSRPLMEVYKYNSYIYTEVLGTIRNVCRYFQGELDDQCLRVTISFLLNGLKDAGTSEARGHAAEALYHLASSVYPLSVYPIREAIGEEAFGPLIDLVNQGYCIDARKAARAIAVLCRRSSLNRSRLFYFFGQFYDFIFTVKDTTVVSEILKILVIMAMYGIDENKAIYKVALPQLFRRLFKILKETEDREDMKNCLLIVASQSLAVDRNSMRELTQPSRKTDVIGILSRISRSGSDGVANLANLLHSVIEALRSRRDGAAELAELRLAVFETIR